MKLRDYMRSKAMAIFLFLLAEGIVALLLWVAGVDTGILFAAAAALLLLFLVATTWDYLVRRRFYSSLKTAIDIGKDSYYVTEHLERPIFVEGQLTYDALARATKDMNDRIAKYRAASDEYRVYVETWIHEVKTPIAASRLTIGNNESDITKLLSHELDRIEAHVEQALYYARSTTVEKDYSIKLVDLDLVVKGAVKKQSRMLIENGIMPHFDGLDIKVYTDPKWLDFIIGQIISNSIKYHLPLSEEHTPEIRFSAQTSDSGFESSKVVLHMADNGIGIPSTDVARVFEKGFTGVNGRSFAKSTGIGLYLCKTLSEKMKLKMSIESQTVEEAKEGSTQHGTTVTIEFPLNKMFFLD